MSKIKLAGILMVAVLVVVAAASGASAYTYNTNLTIGSSGADVTALQTFLVGQGKLVMPAGVSMGYFGNLTKNALAAYQASVGISPAVGYFGPITRAKVNSVDAGTGSTGSTGSTGALSGGDGDFKEYDVLGSPNSKDVNEGASEKVMAFEFEAKDSDLRVERLTLMFHEDTSNTKPWKVLEEVAIYNGSKKIADIDASDSSNWDEEEDDEYSVDFTKLNSVVEEGEKAKFWVEVTASDDIEDDETDTWTVWVAEDGLRATNAEGIDVYEGDSDTFAGATDERTFDLDTAGEDITITVDDEDNEDQEIEIDDNNETDDVTLYTATLKSEDGDINIEEFTVTLATVTGGANVDIDDILSTVYIFVDGDEVGSESADDSISFDDLDIDVEEDDEIEIVIKADVNEGDQFESSGVVKVDSLKADYTNAADDDATETSNDDGGIVTFKTNALAVTLVSSDVAYVGSDESKGVFTLKFKVSAPKNYDIYINDTASSSVAGDRTVNGVEYSFVTGSVATKTSQLLTRVSGGTETSGLYKITKGNNATFEMQIELDNLGGSSSQSVKLGLDAINYATNTNGTSTSTFTSGLDEDFRVGPKTLYTTNLAD